MKKLPIDYYWYLTNPVKNVICTIMSPIMSERELNELFKSYETMCCNRQLDMDTSSNDISLYNIYSI